MLKSEADRGLTAPIVGPSRHSYYSGDEYLSNRWPYIKVLDHDVDKSIIYKLAGWRDGDLPADLLYMILTDENGDILNSGSCIGQSDASFRIHLPTMSNVYTTLKEMKNQEEQFTSLETLAMGSGRA